MLRPSSLARPLLLASALSLSAASRAEEPRAGTGGAPQAQAAPAATADGTPKEQVPGTAAPSLSPRLTPAPGSPARASDGTRKPAAAAAGAPAGTVLTVAEIAEDTVRLAGPNVGLAPKQVGRVVARDGATVGRVEIERVLENGVVARVISGRENVAWGARVRFEAPER